MRKETLDLIEAYFIFVFAVLIIGFFGYVLGDVNNRCPSTQKLVEKKAKVHGKQVKVPKCINKEENGE